MTAARLLQQALARGLTVATAESCTGGLLAGALTAPAGASAIFGLGVVAYSNDAKRALLGVRAATLARHGAVSEAVAREMAEGALRRSGAAVAVGVTGVAGPGDGGAKPEGRVCFGLATADGAEAETVEFGPLGRAAVRRAAVRHALGLLLRGVQRAP